jgi:guanylate kinase
LSAISNNDDESDDTNNRKDSSNDLSPLVVCGPAGIGTRRLVDAFVQDNHATFGRVVSHTTRAPRRHEVDGRDCHFVSHDAMEGMIFREEFLEHVTLSDGVTLYGTSMDAIYAVNNCNDQTASSWSSHVSTTEKIEILDINVAGVRQIKAHAAAAAAAMPADIDTPLRPKYLFVAPKSLHVLRRCLIQRRIDHDLQCDSHHDDFKSHESDLVAWKRLLSPVDTNNRVLADALDRNERRMVQQAVLDIKYGQTKAFNARIIVDPLSRWDEAVTDLAKAIARLYPHLALESSIYHSSQAISPAE